MKYKTDRIRTAPKSTASLNNKFNFVDNRNKNIDASRNNADKYKANTITNPYKALVQGHRGRQSRYDAIQDILQGMGSASPLGEGMKYTPEEDPILNVPDLEKDIFGRNPMQYTNMKPVLDRYLALEKMLKYEMINIKKMLKKGRGSIGEIRVLKKKLDKYKASLSKCKKQIDKSRLYYLWEKNRRAAKAEKENKDLF